MQNITEQLRLLGLVPVVKIEAPEQAVPLAEALSSGGLPCIEITFRTEAAEESIRRISAAFPDMLVGAGTVLTCEQVDRAVNAGADFIVSPGSNPQVIRHCQEKGIPITPGCSTPTDIEQALALGLETVKFFPAEQIGGVNAIKAMAAPYRSVQFMPTGGINPANLGSYLSVPQIIACGGSWMVKPELLAAGDFAAIQQLTKEAVLTMLGFRLAHVGINGDNPQQSEQMARTLGGIFGFPFKAGNSSNFAGSFVEVTKAPFRGEKGHVAIGTYHVDRAAAFLQRQGISLAADTARYDAQGQMTSIYLEDEFGGFAVHLVRQPYGA